MLFPFAVPVLAYAQSDVPLIQVGNVKHVLSLAPYQDELGLMVSAEDATKAFGMGFDYNNEDRTFTIHSPKHGAVILSHNATAFKSGENVFECLPYFFVKNGTPLVEMGFFCEMFNSSYEYDESINKIILYKDIPKPLDIPEKEIVMDESVSLMSASNTTISGKVELENYAKHNSGLSISLVLTPVGPNYQTVIWESVYGGGSRPVQVTVCDKGTPKNIGDIVFDEDEYEKDYTINITSTNVNPANYPYYTIGYEVSNDKKKALKQYGYINNQKEITESYSPMSGGAGNASAYKFSYENNKANIIIPQTLQAKTAIDYKNGFSINIRDYENPSYYDSNQFSITSGSRTYTTDDRGNLSISINDISTGFKISADGYKPFKFPLSLDYLKGSSFNRLYMYKTEYGNGKPLANAIYYNKFNIFAPSGYSSGTSYYLNDTKETCTITPVVTTDNNHSNMVSSMKIVQDTKEIPVNNITETYCDGYYIFSGSTERFTPGVEFLNKNAPIYLVITTNDGSITKQRLNIKCYEMKSQDVDVDMGDSLEFDTPDGEDSIFGGMKLKFNLFENVPADFKVTPDGKGNFTFKGTVGVESKDKEATYNMAKDRIAAKKLKEKNEAYESENPIKSFDNFFKKLSNTGAKEMSELPKAEFGETLKLKLYGYVDGSIDLQDNNFYKTSFQELGLSAKFSFSKDMKRMIMWGNVPGYWGLGVTLEDAVTVVFQDENGKLAIPDKAENEFSIEGEAKAGVGMPGVVTIGATGSGKIAIACEIPISADTLNAIVSGKINLFDYELGLISGSLITLNSPEIQIYPSFEVMSLEEEVTCTENNTPVMQLPRNYASEALVMNVESIELLGLDSNNTNIEVETIADNTYTFPDPQFAELNDGRLLAVWVEDVRTRESDADRTGIHYSIYDGSEWSEPIIIDDDTTADFNPTLKTVNEKLYLTWSNATENFQSGETDVTKIASALETSVAVWEGNEFDVLESVGNKGVILSAITEVNDMPTLVWIEDEDGNIHQTNNKTVLKSATYDSGSWQVSELLSEQNIIDGIDVACVNDNAVIYYSQDTDGDTLTIGDKEIFSYSNGTTSQITDNDVADTKPATTESGVYWYSNSKIAYMNYEDSNTTYINADCPTDKFSVSENAESKIITYTKQGENSSMDVFAVCYDGSEWGNPIKVSASDKYITTQQALVSSDNTFKIMTNDLILNENEFGTSSINLYSITPYSDLEISDLEYNEYSTNGYYMQYLFNLTNNGTTAIKGVKTRLYNNATNSSIDYHNDYDVTILPGETVEYVVDFYNSTYKRQTDVKVVVEPLYVNDSNADNNSATVKVTYDDISVENLINESTEDSMIVGANIFNRGVSQIQNVNVSLVKGNADGTVIESKTIDAIDSGKCEHIYFEMSNAEEGIYYIVCDALENENLLGNNSDFIRVSLLSEQGISGDVDGNESVDSNDAIYLLKNTLLPNKYPIVGDGDVNGDGAVDSDDAIYLLKHTLLPEKYPLNN